MTGFGEAHRQHEALAVSVEVRTINSRYFKLTLRASEGYSPLEPQIESLVRERVKRGTVQVSLRVDRQPRPDEFRLNTAVLDGYRRQLEQVQHGWHAQDAVPLAALLQLPGVVSETALTLATEEQWPAIQQALAAALEQLSQMRAREGQAMAADLSANGAAVAAEVREIEKRVPQVVASYRQRLAERIGKTLEEFGVTLQPVDLVREVGLFAERSDISEEIVRLKSHLEQFNSTLALAESSGRKLDFLTQEMFRETNTIGAKASDVEISRRIIDIKSSIERMREMIQNVE